jgi:hypothetical protein
MNDAELIAKLKSVPVPERPEDYWDDFPSHVRLQLRRRQSAAAPSPAWRIRLVWACDFALLTAAILFCLQYHPLAAVSGAITSHQRQVHRELARLDAGLHRLVLNTDGMGYLLADAN